MFGHICITIASCIKKSICHVRSYRCPGVQRPSRAHRRPLLVRPAAGRRPISPGPSVNRPPVKTAGSGSELERRRARQGVTRSGSALKCGGLLRITITCRYLWRNIPKLGLVVWLSTSYKLRSPSPWFSNP